MKHTTRTILFFLLLLLALAGTVSAVDFQAREANLLDQIKQFFQPFAVTVSKSSVQPSETIGVSIYLNGLPCNSKPVTSSILTIENTATGSVTNSYDKDNNGKPFKDTINEALSNCPANEFKSVFGVASNIIAPSQSGDYRVRFKTIMSGAISSTSTSTSREEITLFTVSGTGACPSSNTQCTNIPNGQECNTYTYSGTQCTQTLSSTEIRCNSGYKQSGVSCVSDTTPTPTPTPTPTDRDDDGIIDSEDKCPDIKPLDKDGKAYDVVGASNKNSSLHGCPLVHITSTELLGENNYPAGERVPIVVNIVKDDNFDVTDLKIEAGVYELNDPHLGTFSIVPPEDVLASRGLEKIATCVSGEENVQAAGIVKASQYALGAGEFKNQATYILLPKVPQHSLAKNYAIGSRVYKECNKPISANSQTIFFSGISPISKYNYFRDPTCVTVSGNGTDQCSSSAISGDGMPLAKAKALTVEELEDATDAQIRDSLCDFNEECETLSGFKVRCTRKDQFVTEQVIIPAHLAISVTTRVTQFFSGSDPLNNPFSKGGVCIAEPVDKAGFCDVAENLAFFKIASDKCTSGGIILIGGLIVLLLLFTALGGKK